MHAVIDEFGLIVEVDNLDAFGQVAVFDEIRAGVLIVSLTIETESIRRGSRGMERKACSCLSNCTPIS
jgi:hypothetical protein